MTTSDEQRKLAAIMFTDMVGFSALSQRDEALALMLLEEHRRIIRDLLPAHGGREVKTTGDGFLLEFPSALAAVRAAVEFQQALHERNESCPADRQVRIRVGIHVGDVVMQDGDIHGDGVNIAARLEPLALAGGICISNAVYEQVQNKIPHPLRALGPTELKNITLPVAVYRVVLPWDGGGSSPAAVRSTGTLWAAVGLALLAGIALALWQPWRARPASVPASTAATAPAIEQKSVAVLAFKNVGDDKSNEYFSDGVSEELLNSVAKVPGLKVSARTAAFHFKDKDLPMAEIARQLGVAYVIEGSVRKSGDKVRISAQLIKAADGFQVWSDTFTRDVKDIFAVQDEIAGLIAQALQLRLGNATGDRLPIGATKNVEAYEAFLKGREAWHNTSAESLKQAVPLFQRAIELDPKFALAYGALAEAYVSLANEGVEPAAKAFPLARAAAERALALDPRIVQAHTALAEYAFHFEWDYEKSDQHLQNALAVDPNYSIAYSRLAGHYEDRNRLEEALAAGSRAVELNPLSPWAGRTGTLMMMKRYDEAIQAARDDIALRTKSASRLEKLGQALILAGKFDEGLRIVSEIAANAPDSVDSCEFSGWAYGRAGQNEKARGALQRLSEMAKSRYVSPLVFAHVAAGLNDRELAFAHLERAFELHDPLLPAIGNDLLFETISEDPRFREMLKRLKLDVYFPEAPRK